MDGRRTQRIDNYRKGGREMIDPITDAELEQVRAAMEKALPRHYATADFVEVITPPMLARILARLDEEGRLLAANEGRIKQIVDEQLLKRAEQAESKGTRREGLRRAEEIARSTTLNQRAAHEGKLPEEYWVGAASMRAQIITAIAKEAEKC